MSTAQMDPAPEVKPGSDDAPKVWVAGKKAMIEQSHEGLQLFENHETDSHEFNEEDMVSIVSVPKGEKLYTPPSFFARESFCALESAGLAKLPETSGFTSAYHKQTRQWHARCAPLEKHYAPSHGPGLRSELKALCMALCQLWEWYVSSLPEIGETEHLDRLRAYTDELEF